jgi:DNA-3-methyladenine glycosylase I
MSLIAHPDGRTRCWWPGTDPLYVAYHDTDWGVPEWDDRALFEKLILDGFQAGLSWITILRKREAFRAAFAKFQPEKIVRFTDRDVERLMADAGIVRNRAKIEGTIRSARLYLDLMEKDGFSRFIWGFVGGEPIQHGFEDRSQVPTETAESRAMSKALKSLGFTFVGPTITYAFMQACGLVNDHMVGCFRYEECRRLGVGNRE